MQLVHFDASWAGHCLKYYNVRVDPPKGKPKKSKPLTWDAVNWKSNDHYHLLGLEERRQDVTFDEIRSAYRRAVLLHHPDKQAQRQIDNAEDDALFKCIQKAFDILSDQERRSQYDSVDFDESIPKTKEYGKDEFFSVFPEVFERNARFSCTKPVPTLRMDMTRSEVEDFYSFWFNFTSSRRFEYLDEEEVMEGGERAEKRYMDKKNKAARQRRKTEDNARITRLVELAYKSDPRVKQYKEDDRLAKEAKKKSTATGNKKPPVIAKASPAATDADAEKKRKEEQIKQAMAAAKEAAAEAKTVKRSFRALFSENNFFSATSDAREMERVAGMMEQALLKMASLDLKDLETRIRDDLSHAVSILDKTVNGGAPVKSNLAVASLASDTITTPPTQSIQKEEKSIPAWTVDQVDLLINAVKAFPPGVPDRWHRISEHLNKSFPVDHEEVLRKAEEVRTGRMSSELATPAVPVPKKRDPRVDLAEPTILVREHVPNGTIDDTTNTWTAEEQHALEAAMKRFGAECEDRWAAVADCLPGRSKADVIKRVKEIAERVKKSKC